MGMSSRTTWKVMGLLTSVTSVKLPFWATGNRHVDKDIDRQNNICFDVYSPVYVHIFIIHYQCRGLVALQDYLELSKD